MPSWCGSDGFPLSWRHYVYGSVYLIRADARADLRLSAAVRVAGSDDSSYKEWRRELLRESR